MCTYICLMFSFFISYDDCGDDDCDDDDDVDDDDC